MLGNQFEIASLSDLRSSIKNSPTEKSSNMQVKPLFTITSDPT